MPAKYLAAVDAGTSGLRCVIVDGRGKTVAVSRSDYTCLLCADGDGLAREFGADQLWNDACQCIASAIKEAKIEPADIGAISATSQREGAVFLDREGRELYAGPNVDLRAVTEGLVIDGKFADAVYRITGHLPSLLFVPAKLKWFEINRPDIYDRIARVLSISDWLVYRLCGVAVNETCGAVEMGLADVSHRRWSAELADLLKIPDHFRPTLVKAGSCVGKVTGPASCATGLPAGIPVVEGAPDTHCGLVAMGITDDWQAGIVSGWSMPVQMVTDRPIFDPQRRIWTGCHLNDANWILESNPGEAGNALNWVREMLFNHDGAAASDGYRALDESALSAPVGAGGVLAYTGPEAMDVSYLRLRWGGFLFPVPFSATNIQRGQLARAALENTCFAVKANCEQITGVAGHAIKEIGLAGGLARLKCLKRILPSILGVPVGFACTAEASALGAAMLAAAGSGLYTSLDEATEAMKSPLEIIEPDRLMAMEYQEYYQNWRSAGTRLKELGEELN